MEQNERVKALEDLLAGDLSPADEKEIRRQIEEDPALQRLLKNEQDILAGIRHWSRKQLRNELKELEARLEPINVDEEVAFTDEGQRAKFPWKPLLAAAGIVLVVALYFVFNTLGKPSTEELYNEFYEPYSAYAPVTMRGEEGIDTPMKEAMLAYENGDYAVAAEKLETLPPSVDRDFYLAHSYLSAGEQQKAVPLLEQLAETGAEPTSTINWYLALAYLKDGHTAESREILERLTVHDNSYQLKARQLLKDL